MLFQMKEILRLTQAEHIVDVMSEFQLLELFTQLLHVFFVGEHFLYPVQLERDVNGFHNP